MKLIRKLFCILLLALLLFVAVAFGYYYAVTKSAVLSPETLAVSSKSVSVFDAQERKIERILPSSRQTTPLSQVPVHTQRAFVDVEDKRFYKHDGFDFKRFVKAVYKNCKAGAFKEGASTISQQLIKNTHLTQEKTLSRKLREWKLTRALERTYTKDEILEKYLNVIYFGHDCFGLHSATKFYFGKSPNELDLADSAILAGLVKAPNHYSPFKNPQACLKRKETVLRLMQKKGDINEKEKQIAMEKPLPTSPCISTRDTGYLHFVFDELSCLSERYAFPLGGNIKIYTYFDERAQSALEEVAGGYTQSDKILHVLDVQTQGFKACVSTVGIIRRLPASLLKPLLVYAPALEKDLLSPATPILDEKIDYGGYAPNNFDGKFHGYVSARECLAQSLNVPAVKILEELRVEVGVQYMQKLGLPVEEEDYSLALALGGMKNGFALHDLVSAYATFANGGNFAKGAFISKITVDDKVVYTHAPASTRVFSEETAFLTTDMLRTTAKTGTAKKLRALPFEIAGKTGTAGTEKGNTDAYAVSYTTRDCVGVWLGNAKGGFIEGTGGGTPCNLLLEINERLASLEGSAPEKFRKPANVTQVLLDKNSYNTAHTLTLADELAPADYSFQEWFKTQAVPRQKSNFFSNPTILPPTLQYVDGKVKIAFNDKFSPLYEYKIERYDSTTHAVLYVGKLLSEFIDDNVTNNESYIYTVTPIYKNREGERVVLPAVSTKNGEFPTENDEEILEKKWWEN